MTLKTLAVRCGVSLPVAMVLAFLLARGVVAPTPLDAAASCESLATLALPAGTITSAQAVAAGAFSLPGGGRAGRGAAQLEEAVKSLPAFCRVEATLKPSSDSDIKIEVWMPTSGWNGKYQAVGNGAWNGNIAYPAMTEALRRGYATSSTDTGHVGGSASFALGHPEKLIDFGYRSEHEMALTAKKVVAAYYGNGPRFAYWNGCSAGGRQAIEGSADVPGRFRRHYRRSACTGLDWPGGLVASGFAGDAQGRSELHSTREVPGDSQRGARGVRRHRRREGRRSRKPADFASSIRKSSSARAPTSRPA